MAERFRRPRETQQTEAAADVSQPGYSRISNDEMRRLMIETSAKLADIREYRSPSPMLAEPFFLGLLAIRGAAQVLSVYLYLRGRVLLVWWWELLLQSRDLLN